MGAGFPDNCCGIDATIDSNTRNLEDDWDNLSGHIVVHYTVSDDAMLYASLSTGYRSGGFRLGTIQPNPCFNEEKMLAYEIGYKGSFTDTLQVNAAA